MSTVKSVSKLMSVMLGLLGLGAIFTSCNKETECYCSNTETYNGQTYTYGFDASVDGDCETLDFEDADVDCKEK